MRQIRLLTIVAGSVTAVFLLSAASGGGDFAVPVMLVATLVLGGIGYGVTKNKADAAHARLDTLQAAITRRDEALDEKLDGMSETLTEVRILVASIARAKDSGGGTR